MWNKCKLVMLSTNEKVLNLTPIVMFNNKLFNCYSPNYSYANAVFQNFYILSDEKIKEGDWYENNGVIFKADDKFDDGNNPNQNQNNKKIIATTDKSLLDYAGDTDYYKQSIQLIPQSFIEYFVSEYNKGNVITEVMVEYEYKYHSSKEFYGNKADWVTCNESQYNSIKKEIPSCHIRIILKTNPDNTINIKLIKDSWSLDEVKVIVEKAINEREQFLNKSGTLSYNFDKWIKENL